jgi:hypothetical protein
MSGKIMNMNPVRDCSRTKSKFRATELSQLLIERIDGCTNEGLWHEVCLLLSTFYISFICLSSTLMFLFDNSA